ncbi:MAG: HTH-type transcriptional repressor YcgE [Bacteroidetes bacterium ADurb.BinA174]|nr:MAG: HTH-type transcriptional repressor YcgE [Bacteroidetes bacterium ADurb.BinA174]
MEERLAQLSISYHGYLFSIYFFTHIRNKKTIMFPDYGKNRIFVPDFYLTKHIIEVMGKRKKPIQFNDKRLFYSIQEVADHFAVNVSLLRFWEKEFDNINPKKTAGGTRQYTKEDIQQVQLVYNLVKEKGMTLEGARQILKSNKDEEEKRVEAINRLQEIKKELLLLKEEFASLHEHQKYTKTEIE